MAGGQTHETRLNQALAFAWIPFRTDSNHRLEFRGGKRVNLHSKIVNLNPKYCSSVLTIPDSETTSNST